jgi:hypothetical protein
MTLAIQTSAKPSPIDNCPNEVLDNIISYALEDEGEFEYVENGERRRVRSVVALMHVSRRFRHAALHNSIWRERDFCFSTFMSHPSYSSHVENEQVRMTRLCAVLLNDPQFLSFLDGISGWLFLCLESLIATLAYIPSFKHCARTVTLDFNDAEMDVAISRLGHCRNITELRLHSSYASNLDLSNIATYLPQVKTLLIELPISFIGSLETLRNVEEFSLRGGTTYDETEDHWPTAFLPFASAKTLTRLSLDLDVFEFWYDSPGLPAFINLKHLTTKGYAVCENIVESLIDSPANLESLESSVYIRRPKFSPDSRIVPHPDLEPALSLFDCRCLRHLKTIRLSILHNSKSVEKNDDFPPYYVDNCMKVVERMVKRICVLEEVVLLAGCDLDRAVYLLSELENLECLTWDIPSERYLQGMKEGQNPDDVFGKGFQGQGKEVDVTIDTSRNWEILDGTCCASS